MLQHDDVTQRCAHSLHEYVIAVLLSEACCATRTVNRLSTGDSAIANRSER
jgi:hypothetical protein